MCLIKTRIKVNVTKRIRNLFNKRQKKVDQKTSTTSTEGSSIPSDTSDTSGSRDEMTIRKGVRVDKKHRERFLERDASQVLQTRYKQRTDLETRKKANEKCQICFTKGSRTTMFRKRSIECPHSYVSQDIEGATLTELQATLDEFHVTTIPVTKKITTGLVLSTIGKLWWRISIKGCKQIAIPIESIGGNHRMGMWLARSIRSYVGTCNIIGIVPSFAYSMAGILLMACHRRVVSKESEIMMHGIRITTGVHAGMKTEFDQLAVDDQETMEAIAKWLGNTKEKIALDLFSKDHSDRFIDGKTLITNGYAEDIESCFVEILDVGGKSENAGKSDNPKDTVRDPLGADSPSPHGTH